MNLSHLSADELIALSKKAKKLAEDLRKEEPSNALCMENGMENRGYQTVRNGWVNRYEGTVIVEMDNGTKWECTGVKAKGDGWDIYRDSYISKRKIT